MLLTSGLSIAPSFSADEQSSDEVVEPTFTQKMESILFQDVDDGFIYVRENRTDPFVPFIQERVSVTEMPMEELSGMQKFEPGQLKVVAIMLSPVDKFAMVQDSNNQGYILREGILLGRTGVVEAIVPNKVIVKNYSYNLAGDKIYKTVEMVLRQEGEK
jgi:type IV pilus assembly protein PilP